jgi:hypothetical protein
VGVSESFMAAKSISMHMHVNYTLLAFILSHVHFLKPSSHELNRLTRRGRGGCVWGGGGREGKREREREREGERERERERERV